ncbi:hypothetical protein BKH43_02510 [Helicobacter sp. 13S00401-1]|uniref:hypothetical protein n=1 Tax=Helicobacter sp. 13S00401-1 TaxID=1905758 RepID=UPI000BA59ECE|nr:hypothetical protein [Helicobacter sp. 13S00401-1]PAF51097.1 hypothetical protein BKH43_02510 [Helicobacter sp. 13S00401-1]
MAVLKKVSTKTTTSIKLFGKTLVRKERLLSSTSLYVLNLLIYKKRLKPYIHTSYLLGVKIASKQIDLTSLLSKQAKNKEFIYICFHSGDFYYLAVTIKQNFAKYKDVLILSKFAYLKQVLEMLDFEEAWIESNFLVVKEFYPSLALWCKSSNTLKSKASLDHEKGWMINEKVEIKDRNYPPFSDSLAKFLGKSSFDIRFNYAFKLTPSLSSKKDIKTKAILLIPQSQFNGDLSLAFCSVLLEGLKALGFHVFINTKSKLYDSLLDASTTKIFLNYKDTYELGLTCKAVIAIRCGLVDCLQSLAFNKVLFFIIYNQKSYPHYKFFKNFYEWFKDAYSLNHINQTTIFNEYFYEKDYIHLLKDILEKLKEDGDV